MALPSDLLAALLVDAKARGEKSDEDHSEEVLTTTLSSCGDLAGGFSSNILGSALFDGVETGDGDWDCCIRLLRLILGLPDSIGDKASKRSEVPPHIVMRTATDHSLDYFDCDGDCDGEEIVAETGEGVSIDTKSILLVLLSSAAVRLTASDIRQTLASSTDSQIKIRWRRASSVAMECIGLYQRLVLGRLERAQSNGTTSKGERSSLVDAVTLLGTYVAGSINDLLAIFREQHTSAALVEKIEAGLISATSMTARFVAHQNPIQSQQLCLDLVRCCVAPLGSIQLDVILLKPLRQWEYDHVTSIDNVDDPSEDEDSDGSTNARSSNEIFAEMVCGNVSSSDNPGGMRTQWDNAGIALLAYHILVDRTMLPSAYSPEFYFAMFYPHSGALLHLAQSDDEQLGSELRFAIISKGIELLSLTLDLSNNCAPTNDAIIPYARLSSDDVTSPLGPVGTVQLLLNTAVALSDTASGGLNNSNSNSHVSKSKILELIRKLLHCYPSLLHVQSVAILLQRCPFDYLEPVLLDLLRPALLTAADTASMYIDDGVEDATFDILESKILREMKSHIGVGDDGDIRLIDIDGLVSRVEQYTCASLLLRLLLIRREGMATSKRHERVGRSRLDSAVSTLIDFYGGLCKILKDSSNANLFRLDLLDDALGELERQSTSRS